MQNFLQVGLDKSADMQNNLHIVAHLNAKEKTAMRQFTAGEFEVMRILWEHGELKPAEIQERFPRPIKNAALRSYLTILVEKGHLLRRSKGKAFYYRPKTKRDSTFRSMLGELVNTFCGGSSEALLCHLLAQEKLSQEELLDLQRLAQEQPAATQKSSESPRRTRP
jgi:BlaI family transcriptional regulator, penicillinase repressor